MTTRPYTLSDRVSPDMAKKTQMRFGSLTPGVEAMSYVRAREQEGDFTVVGFVTSATRSLVAEVSTATPDETGDERYIISVPFENNESYCGYMIESDDLGYGPSVFEADGYATICEVVRGAHINPEDVDADLVIQLHRQSHLRTPTGSEPDFNEFLLTTILKRLNHDYAGSARCDAKEAAIDYLSRAAEKSTDVIRAHGDLSLGNIIISDKKDQPQLIDPNPVVSSFEIDLGRILTPAVIGGLRDFADAEFSEIEREARSYVKSLGLPRGLIRPQVLTDAIVGTCATVLIGTRR